MNVLYPKPSKQEVSHMMQEVLQVIIIYTIIHIIACCMDGGKMFDEKTLKYLVYIVVAYIVYHFIIKRIPNIFKGILIKKDNDNS